MFSLTYYHGVGSAYRNQPSICYMSNNPLALEGLKSLLGIENYLIGPEKDNSHWETLPSLICTETV